MCKYKGGELKMDGNVGYVDTGVTALVNAITASCDVVKNGVIAAVDNLNAKIEAEWKGSDEKAFEALAVKTAEVLNVELKKVFDNLAADVKAAESHLISRQNALAAHYGGGGDAAPQIDIKNNTLSE